MIAQPADKIEHVGVAPHPCGKAAELSQRFVGIRIRTTRVYKTVYPVGIRPVGLSGNALETFFRNQPFGDLRAPAVELMRAVRGFADQDKSGIPNKLKQRIVIVHSSAQRYGRVADGLQGFRSHV